MQLKQEILKKMTAYSESLIDSHGHYVQCVIEDDWSTLADEILTLLQQNNAGQPNASKPNVSGAFYCQRSIEDEDKCSEQCEHCRGYYAPLQVNKMTC